MKKSRYNITVDNGLEYVIANTMTGAIVKLSSNEWQDYLAGNFTDDFWRENGLVVDDELDELDLLKRVYEAAHNNKHSARITICPTLDCNFSCPYCYERREKGRMSEIIQEGVLKKVRQLYEMGIEKIYITWYGGEPLLCKDIISYMSKSIIKIAEDNGRQCQFAIITNGYLIDKDIVNLFREIKMKSIQITLDGNKEMHDKRRKRIDGAPTFDVIVNNIKMLLEAGLHVNIRVNVDSDNIDGYNIVRQYFEQYTNVNCYPAFVTEEKTQNVIQRAKCIKNSMRSSILKKIEIDYRNIDMEKVMTPEVGMCMANHKHSYVFSYNGNIYKCINDVSIPQNAVGNIMTGVVHDEGNYYNYDAFNEEGCSMCSYLPMCYGRCAWEYKEKGERSCPDIKYLLKDILRYKYLGKEEIYNGNYSETAEIRQ